LLWKKANDLGYSLGVDELLDRLTEIRKAEILTITRIEGKPQREELFKEMAPALSRLYDEPVEKAL
jgi:hypothetical protein